MRKKRTFISFDYDNDSVIKMYLVGQARNEDSPFEITDMSIKHAIAKDWEDKARIRIKGCDVVVVLCGEHTDSAHGVDVEIRIAQQEGIPYFLLWGYSDKVVKKPKAARFDDKIYKWSWDNLKALFNGAR